VNNIFLSKLQVFFCKFVR